MKITADVDMCNRLLPSFNMRSKGRSMKAQLSVGRKPGSDSKESDTYLLLCTKQNPSGHFYKLKKNIEQCFSKFVNDGKATIRFTEPPHDVCISKADPIQLKAFLNVIRLGFRGEGLDKVTLSALAPATGKQMDKLKTRMTVTCKRDYPITTNFPSSLEALTVSHCTLKKIDSRMLKLRHLSMLDLSDNVIRTLPDSINDLDHLAELKLCNNQIEEIPQSFCSGKLQRTLTLLDLTNNKIKVLRPYFCNLQALVTLKLDRNALVWLPAKFGQLQRLRYFSACENQLKTLPASFTHLSLNSLDLFNNSFLDAGSSSVINRLHSPSLLEWAARSIVTHRVPYTEEDVGHLMDFLSSAHLCLCGSYSFRSHVHYLAKVDLQRVAASFTALDQHGCKHAPCEAFLCSQKCLERYQRNPYASIWT